MRSGEKCALAAMFAIAALLSMRAGAGTALGDVVMNRNSTRNGVPAVVFPHWKHRSRFRCYVCHPQPFEMKTGANPITMDALRSGRFCALCHDAKVAFPVAFETCRKCHSGVAP